MSNPASVQGYLKSAQPGPRLIDGQDLITLVTASASGRGGLTALAGGGFAGATPITTYISEFTTVATANDSAVLPPAISGAMAIVVNSGAQSMRLYAQTANPANSGAQDVIEPIAGGATVDYIAIPANAIGIFVCGALGRWKSLNQ